MNNPITQEAIKAYLPPWLGDMEIAVFDTVDSTNSEARRRIESGHNRPMIIAANAQTAGRGRRGRSFYSPAYTGLYMSIVIHPHSDFDGTVYIMTAAAVAVAKALERVAGVSAGIKWVNDIFVGERKVCGILAESVFDQSSGSIKSVIIGIGVNVTTCDFPEDIADTAGAAGVETDRSRLAAAITEAWFETEADRSTYLDEYRRRSIVIGRRVRCMHNNESFCAEAVDIDERGGLIIRRDNGTTETLSSGEVSLRLE
ncbi:MAG: biotin--[acetyl-CoA-carboxylase] ligase [Ruminococcaceae bacterium]|nr:biotin--[acetyl-CoA-carboxylase] ligase [Oscillospiraceae bacterium]